jgi:hypothetical protein
MDSEAENDAHSDAAALSDAILSVDRVGLSEEDALPEGVVLLDRDELADEEAHNDIDGLEE